MPELPEVETVVRTLQPLVGRRLGAPRVLRKDVVRGARLDLRSFARGRAIGAIHREAKRIVFELNGGRQIQFHLGMTGQLNVKRRAEPLAAHTHLILPLVGNGEELRFRDVRRFGGVWLVPAVKRTDGDSDQGRLFGSVGPDALTVSLRAFGDLLARRRQVKALLLDQQAIAGLGNIYVDESLFKARIHPLTTAALLSNAEIRSLHRAMQCTLRAAIRAGGSTIRDYRSANGEEGWFQYQHQAYGREGRPCRRCRTLIERIQVAGRSSHVCPRCQKVFRC